MEPDEPEIATCPFGTPTTVDGLLNRAKKQKLSDEMDEDDIGGADWQYGYDAMVVLCRSMAVVIKTQREMLTP